VPARRAAVDDQVLVANRAVVEPALEDLADAGRVAGWAARLVPDVWGRHAVMGTSSAQGWSCSGGLGLSGRGWGLAGDGGREGLPLLRRRRLVSDERSEHLAPRARMRSR